MSDLWQDLIRVFRFELWRQGRRRAYLFTTFGIPLIAVVLLFGYQFIQGLNAPAEDEVEDTTAEALDFGTIGYVDHSGLFSEPGMFAAALVRYDDEETALAALEAETISSVYVVAEDYMETAEITQYAESFGINVLTSQGYFRSFLLQNLLEGSNPQLIGRLQAGLNLTEHRVNLEGETEAAQNEGASFIVVYVFAIMLGITTFFASGYLMQSVIEEKETRMVEVILSTVRPVPLLAGKVLASGLLGLGQILLWGATVVFLLGRLGLVFPDLEPIDVPPAMVVWGLVYFLLGYLFFAGIYAAIGAVSTSMREGPQLAVFVTLPAMLPFYFLAIFTESPNAALPVILSLVPVTAPLSMIQRLAVTSVPGLELVISVVLLFVAGIGSIWLSGRLFRVNTLLAGQMPKLRDVLRIVREG